MAVKKSRSQQMAEYIKSKKNLHEYFCNNKEVVEEIEQQAKDKLVDKKTEDYNRSRTSVSEGLGRFKWDDPNYNPEH